MICGQRLSIAEYRKVVAEESAATVPALSTTPRCSDRISLADYRKSKQLAEKGVVSDAVPAKNKEKTAELFIAPKATEDEIQRACAEWVEIMTHLVPVLEWMTHVPNGGKRPKGEAGKLKAQGVKSGVPDFLLPIRCGNHAGIAIELKSSTGRLSKKQEAWLKTFSDNGYHTDVCRSLDEFIQSMARALPDLIRHPREHDQIS